VFEQARAFFALPLEEKMKTSLSEEKTPWPFPTEILPFVTAVLLLLGG
jgi:isopenicillin N synthase-like dioxygenase